MLITKEKLQHINTIAHEGKVVVVATDADGKLWYIVKQDGFEDSYLNQKEEERTGWEDWQLLELPNEANDKSVIDKEKEEFTYQNNSNQYILRSLYKTHDQSAVAPVQLVSGLGFLYIFRQSKSNTLLVDRFVLDGLTNTLTRKLEVRFKRSKQKHKPSKNQKKGKNGLENIDSLDYTDINGQNFYEPTTELSIIKDLQNGWFSVVLLPTAEQDKQRWHIFAYNSDTKKVHLTTLRSSEEGLFDIKDYTILDPEPRKIPGIITRVLNLGNITITKGLSATKYDLQRERETEEEDEQGKKIKQLLRESVRVMLAVSTSAGNVISVSFAVAADGTLSQINETPATTIVRSFSREVLLPSSTLDNIKAIGQSNPPPQGQITGIGRGEEDAVVLTSETSTQLDSAKITEVKITDIQDYNRLYSQVKKIDDNTFEVTPNKTKGGNWEVVPPEETGLIYNGIVTAYQITSDGKLRVTALNHGLDNGDEVQIIDTKNYNGTYTVTKIDDKTFSLDGVRWQAGTAIGATLQSKKRRGVTFDGVKTYIELPPQSIPTGDEITIECWAKGGSSLPEYTFLIEAVDANNQRILNVHLPWIDGAIIFDCGGDNADFDRINKNAQATDYKLTWSHWAFTKNAKTGEMKIYLNGQLWHSGTGKTKKLVNAAKVRIGNGYNFAGFYEGQIAEVRIWNKARTADEIKNSMYLQLTGQEVGLVGYWRLDAIVEEKERRVIDFSVNGNDGIVYGGAYVSAVTLNRNLAGTTTPAIKYENGELFAVSERGTYLEEFEFKTNNNVNPNNANGSNGKIFALTYKGKKSRYAQDWIPIRAEATEITAVGNNWYKASSRFTVPDGVSLMRSFGIGDIKGTWQTLEIRHHKVRLVSDSITETKYTDTVTQLTTLADNQIQLQESLKQLGLKEKQEALLLKEKRELQIKIDAYNAQGATRERIAQLNTQLNSLATEGKNLENKYNAEKSSPFNYVCHIVNLQYENYRLAPRGMDGNYPKMVLRPRDNEDYYHKWKFVSIGSNSYHIINLEYENYRLAPRGMDGDCYKMVLRPKDNEDYYHKWKFVSIGSNSYHIINLEYENYRLAPRGMDGDCCKMVLRHKDNEDYYHKWKLLSLGQQSNDNIPKAYFEWQLKLEESQRVKNYLDLLNSSLSATPQEKASWDAALRAVNDKISTIQTDLNTLNTTFINGVRTTQQVPQKMPILKTDSRGFVTQGAVLGFVRPVSRLSAIETCEGNVQLSYFDDQGCMRQTNFDATSDSNNATFEQWIPDALRTCLNFNTNSSIVKLEPPVPLGEEWTIEAWFAYPLPEGQDWNTLTRGKEIDHHILVKREANTERLGTYNRDNFFDSGYDMRSLSPGWHHITAVAQGKNKEAKTTFYIDGKKVGESKAKTTSNVYAIGNYQAGSQHFGKVAEVRLWGIALSAEEIAVNSKTLLTGNEPGLLAYYPFNEATGTQVRDKTGNGNNGQIQGASWWGCAAPIGNLGHQVMQFDGTQTYIELPAQSIPTGDAITIEFWAKGGSSLPKSTYLIQAVNANNQRILSIYLPWGDSQIYFDCGTADCDRIQKTAQENNYKLGWSHWTFTKNATTGEMKIYLNGQLWHSITGKSQRLVSAAKVRIGSSVTGSAFYEGQIADLRIWKTARTKEEIQADMNKRLTGKESGLVAYYPLNKTTLEGTTTKVLDLVNNNNGTVTQAILASDQTLPINGDALVCCEYSTVSKDRSAMMRRFFASPTSQGVNLLPDKRIEQLELKWIGNGQFAPTLLGYIEGAPPIPSENLTIEENYDGATSVELALSEDVQFNWKRTQDSGLGANVATFVGMDMEASAGVILSTQVAKVRAGYTGNLNFSYQFQNESSITSSSSLSMTDKLDLVGNQEQNVIFPHLGKRFIPKNVGYALVVSALADVFVTRLKRTGTMIGYQTLPVENIPPDVNTISFLINPAYTMSGSLDGMTGSSATSQRFFKHVPQMRSQFGSLYPASYYRLQEAYDLKQQIEQQDKNREAYFANFNSRLLDEASLDRETNAGDAPGGISVNRPEGKPPTDNLNDEQSQLQQQVQSEHDKQSDAEKKKREEIAKKIKDQEKRSHATESFASWQKKMEDIQIRAGKRNIVNTYVWDADGGLHSEAQSFANTAEHSIGGSFSLNAALGWEGKFSAGGPAAELTTQATVNLTQTMTKTETRSKGIQLNVDLSGVEGRGVTDYNDYPILPGEKVKRYRFMSFYLEGSTNNFHDFFSYVVDPEWLASNSEGARALRQAKGKTNKAWRVLHRVTYVERPALMGFGRDVRQLPAAEASTDLGQLQAKVDKLEKENAAIQRKLDTILQRLPK